MVLNWTCAGCGHVNFIDVEQGEDIKKRLGNKYPARAELINCDKCRSQVSVQARTIKQ